MPAKKNSRRSSRPKSQRVKPRSQRAKPRVDQEAIDDQKFQEKIERKRFFDRIVREANEALLCPGCFSADWKMHHQYWISIVENSLLATMICRKCKHKLPFATQIEPYEDEDEEEEPDGLPFGIFGFRPRPRRRRKLDLDQFLRFQRFL